MSRIEDFAAVILARLPATSQVLEIGAGDGRLAQILACAGHDVVAIDPDPKPGFSIARASFEEYDAGERRFDCIVASLVLHHVHDLEACFQKVNALLDDGGILVVDDYGWERLDDATAQRRWGAQWKTEAAAWRSDRQDLHTSNFLLDLLRRRFAVASYHDHPYFDDGAFDDALAFTVVTQGRNRCPF